MCGIAGIYAFNQIGRLNMINLRKATEVLESRGPDDQGLFNTEFVGLGHRRLSIIDTSYQGHQPMSDPTGRYTIIYNGEIYNYQDLRKQLVDGGINFSSETDTEVLLYLYIQHGSKCLNLLNGFFAFAVYDAQNEELFIARDRFGIKPLYYFIDQDKFLFASQLKSLMAFGIPNELDRISLNLFFRLNYIPAPKTIFSDVYKLEPGCCITLRNGELKKSKYYKPPQITNEVNEDNLTLRELLEQSVKERLVADVPVGTYLSGGVDSSIISSIASKYHKNIKSFSIGFSDDKFFDESRYAELVAKHLGTDHTTFKVSKRDMYNEVSNVLDCLDEPFADSSAIAVYILSKKTRKEVTVALSGDGADELFAGYNKHAAFYRYLNRGFKEGSVIGLDSLWRMMPKSRNSLLTNKFRQFERFATFSRLEGLDQYLMLATFLDFNSANSLFMDHFQVDEHHSDTWIESQYGNIISSGNSMNEWLNLDQKLVLPDDMLVKVDRMSMANSLEVRVPFLDHRLVEFVNRLPADQKIERGNGKKVLKETFRKDLPKKIMDRKKHGFEVPLLDWFKGDMKSMIYEDLLSEEWINEQAIFNAERIKHLLGKLQSSNPEDSHATIWALIVFQHWFNQHIR